MTITVWLDLDGVLRRGEHGTGGLVSSSIVRRLAALPAKLQWLTMRGAVANLVVPGLGQLPIAARPGEYPPSTWLTYGPAWWKLQAVRSLASGPSVWVDDLLGRVPAAHQWAQVCGAPCLLVAPESDIGLTESEVDRISSFVDEHRSKAFLASRERSG